MPYPVFRSPSNPPVGPFSRGNDMARDYYTPQEMTERDQALMYQGQGARSPGLPKIGTQLIPSAGNRTPAPLPGEVGSSLFTRSLPRDAHSIRQLQLGLRMPANGVMDSQTQQAWLGSMNARRTMARDGFARDADMAAQAAAPTTPSRGAVADVLGNKPALTLPTPTTPPVVAPGTGSKLGALLGKGVSAVGAGIKANPLGALNAALGMAGALEYATAKAPEMPGRPAPYQPGVRAAQGLNVTALEAGRRQIQSAQLQAGRATGADVGTTAATRLLAQQQAGEQQGMLSIKDNEAFQQDQRRVDEQQRSDYQANYQTQRSYDEKKYDLQQRQFEARRQQGAGMSQAALTYFTQDRADQRNQQARSEESALYAKYGIAPPEYRTKKKTSATTTSTVESDANGGRLPFAQLHARGGTLKIKTKASFGVGSGVRARASKAFEERMDTITSQAMAAFHTTLREASNKRAKGLSGR